MDKISKILIAILLFLVVFSAIFLSAFSDKNTKDITHVLTKAICDKNTCQDYEIACHNRTILSINPVGNVVKFSDDWEDIRTYEERNNLC